MTVRNVISLILICFVTNIITTLSGISFCVDVKFDISLREENKSKAFENKVLGENICVYERERKRRIEKVGVYRSVCRDILYSILFLHN